MDTLNFAAPSGEVVSNKMFGTPFSRFYTSGDPERYTTPLDALSSQSIRVWYNPLVGAYNSTPSEISVADTFAFAALHNMPIVLCIETKGVLKDDEDSNILTPRKINYEVIASIKDFIKDALSKSGALASALPDAIIDAIEIGNEYWGGDRMTSLEYGKVANALSIAIRDAIDELSGDTISDPNILVQMGSGYSMEFETQQESSPYFNLTWDQAVEVANLDIISQISSYAASTAIDGLVEHYYFLRNTDSFHFQGNYLGYINSDIDIWQRNGFEDKLIYITEWNNKQSNPGQFGLKGAGVMIEMVENMIRMGVDAANVWPFQHNHTRLFDTLSLDASGDPRMTPRGAVFALMSENLPGTRWIESNLTTANGYSYELNAYSSEEKYVFYVSSRTARTQEVSLDLSKMVGDNTSLIATHVTFDPTTSDGLYYDGTSVKPVPRYQDPDALAIVSNLSNVGNAENVQFMLKGYEVVQLVFNVLPGQHLLGTRRSDTLVGADGRDTIVGDSGSDRLISGSASDLVSAGSGNDWISSGSGDDTVRAGSGFDFVRDSRGDSSLYGEGGDDTLHGGSGRDKIYGGVGDDLIFGGPGNDIIYGESGQDILTGGDGRDRFVFSAIAGSFDLDTISDFITGRDSIVLSGFDLSKTSDGRLESRSFVSNTSGKATSSSDRIIYEIDTGRLLLDLDGNGGRTPVHFATLSDDLALTAREFWIV